MARAQAVQTRDVVGAPEEIRSVLERVYADGRLVSFSEPQRVVRVRVVLREQASQSARPSRWNPPGQPQALPDRNSGGGRSGHHRRVGLRSGYRRYGGNRVGQQSRGGHRRRCTADCAARSAGRRNGSVCRDPLRRVPTVKRQLSTARQACLTPRSWWSFRQLRPPGRGLSPESPVTAVKEINLCEANNPRPPASMAGSRTVGRWGLTRTGVPRAGRCGPRPPWPPVTATSPQPVGGVMRHEPYPPQRQRGRCRRAPGPAGSARG